MKLLDKLEKKFHGFSIPNITLYLIFGQIVVFVLSYFKVVSIEMLALHGSNILNGEYWRIATFLFIPIPTNIFFALLTWYLYYLYGTALESSWGTFKYNFYIFLSYLLTITVSFIMPNEYITNTYIYLTIFLAFAYLFPDFVLYIFFIIPVKVKWLALITYLSYVAILIFGTWIQRIALLVSFGNFLLFFGQDIFQRIKYAKKKMHSDIAKIKSKNKPFHKCAVCGITDIDSPDMDFRYCNECGGQCYCSDHLYTHKCAE